MTRLDTEPRVQLEGERGHRIRVVYRDGSGEIHLDWPAARILDAIQDVQGTVWVDIHDYDPDANGDVEALLSDVFHFHPLAIEDALKECHVPRVDDWDGYLYLVFHTIDFEPETDDLQLHELDIFLGPNYLVTYHTEALALIDWHRRNIERDSKNRLRHGADHLLYHLLDKGASEYMPALEHLDDAVDAAQTEVFEQPTTRTIQSIFQIKRSTIRLHRILGPQREMLNRLARDEYAQIAVEHRVYFRDVYDHLVRIHDITESLRDLISGALDTYLSAISNRTNEIMKTLTLVTVMFMPMSFLAGFFGMNFFGATLEFKSWLPKATLFTLVCLVTFLTPAVMWLWARRRGWF